MRFVLVSTHTDQTTGYSKVAYNLLKQLATLSPRVKTFHFGFQRHPSRPTLRKPIEGITVYDAAANEEPKEEGFGFNKIHEYLEMVNPDVVMIYNDPLIIYRFIECMKHERGKSPYKLWIYVDQVYEGIAMPLIQQINKHADRIYCFSEYWKKTYLTYEPVSDVRILEHAVDPTTFSVLPTEGRTQIRSNMNIPENAVIFLNANRNSQRKRLDLTVGGFARLLKQDPTKPYYLIIVSNLNPQTGAYYDIPHIFLSELQHIGLDPKAFFNRLVLIDSSPPNVIGDEGINQLYNVADVGINTSDGEGFGLCQLEHMYTGAPQIVTDVGTYRLFLDEKVAEFVPQGDRVYHPIQMPLGFFAPSFSMNDVGAAMSRMIATLDDKKRKTSAYSFKSWATVCDSFLEDVLMQANSSSQVLGNSYQVANVSVLEPSAAQP
jgi:glycosyltransferase involved in cell wall biosynthesis